MTERIRKGREGHYALVPVRLLASVQLLEEQLPRLAARVEATELKLKLSGAREVADGYDRVLHAVEAVRNAQAASERQLRADLEALRTAGHPQLEGALERLEESVQGSDARLAEVERRVAALDERLGTLADEVQLVEDALVQLPAAAAAPSPPPLQLKLTPVRRARWLQYPAVAAALGMALGLWWT